jgi:hypothetical protein
MLLKRFTYGKNSEKSDAETARRSTREGNVIIAEDYSCHTFKIFFPNPNTDRLTT